MSEPVWKEAYEIVGDGLAVAEAFYAARESVVGQQFSLAKKYGAKGYRPSHNGGIRSLFFAEVPKGFRKIGTEKGDVECVPHKGTALGKAAAQDIAEAPHMQTEGQLADAFGWDGRSPIDGNMWYRSTATKLVLPSIRYLLCLPRQQADGWIAPPTLKPITMGEYYDAFDAHNAAVEARRVAAE